jgi:mycothiol synthase
VEPDPGTQHTLGERWRYNTDLNITDVTHTNESLLIAYTRDHGREHDDSYLPGRDFALSPQYPSCLLLEDGEVVGAACLMRNRRYLSVRKGRFAIFHSTKKDQEAYSLLLEAFQPHLKGLDSVHLFLPTQLTETRTILEELGFRIERFSFVLERPSDGIEEVEFPPGYMVTPLESSNEEGIRHFSEILNQAFQDLAGHTPSLPRDIQVWFDYEGYLPGGICLLKKGAEPVGTVCVTIESENPRAAELGAFGIAPDYQGLGLGRKLLRYGVAFAASQGLSPVILAVNAENETALELYRSEGFSLTESLVCYRLDCG